MSTTTNTTDANILAAARLADGDYRATERRLARFCTEALVACAKELVVPVKFASEPLPTWREPTRDEAMWRICGWANFRRVDDWGVKYRAARAAAEAEFPAAIEALGAAL